MLAQVPWQWPQSKSNPAGAFWSAGAHVHTRARVGLQERVAHKVDLVALVANRVRVRRRAGQRGRQIHHHAAGAVAVPAVQVHGAGRFAVNGI
jgi:hypothetical protein